MADEEQMDEQIEAAEETMEAEGSPVSAEESAAVEAAPAVPAAEDAPAEEPVAEEAAAEEAAAEEAPAEQPAAEEAPAPAAAPAPTEPVVIVHPKERRRAVRQRSSTTAGPSLTIEERQAERDALRTKNNKARAQRRAKVRAKKPPSTVAPAVEVEHAVGRQKTRQGVVVSDKAAKTITVRIDTSRRHRRYQKIVRSSKTLHAHDEHNDAHEGDLVRIIETRPLSALKRWRLAEVVERAR
jgi:small subunit ribosomal protein S17